MIKNSHVSRSLLSETEKIRPHPTAQWNEPDNAEPAQAQAISSQALRDMIERKRHNDAIRKREFEMLRKLRQGEAAGRSGSGPPPAHSFFNSSMPSRNKGRAGTLEKINEIEAEMAMQWWNTKSGSAAAPQVQRSGSFAASDTAAQRSGPQGSTDRMALPADRLAAARTLPVDLPQERLDRAAKTAARHVSSSNSASDAVPPAQLQPIHEGVSSSRVSSSKLSLEQRRATEATMPASLSSPGIRIAHSTSASGASTNSPAAQSKDLQAQSSKLSGAPDRSLLLDNEPSRDNGFFVSQISAMEIEGIAHSPELEEAAICFVNGDDQGAETVLLEAIYPTGACHEHQEAWLTVLDFYRATGHSAGFENLAIDFAVKFNRSSPMWVSLPQRVSQMVSLAPSVALDERKADWKCPAVLGIQSLAVLKAILARSTMPWVLDWADIESIEDDAVAPLVHLFLSWASQPVRLRVAHVHSLETVLRVATPSGVRSVDQERWKLRMAYMRLAHRPDEFELAALDFCVTYEVSPPSWQNAQCEFKQLDVSDSTGLGQTIIGDVVHDATASGMHTEIEDDTQFATVTTQTAVVELSGQISGDPQPVLDQLQEKLMGADVMCISCKNLVRVDFSAAGTMLNWVIARENEGRLVQFTDMHRLLAVFFHLIGISKHAQLSICAD
jgi:anti-anti-sigma regulatory factor